MSVLTRLEKEKKNVNNILQQKSPLNLCIGTTLFQFIVSQLRKLVHAINRDFTSLKIENFQLKNFDIFLIFAQNIDCGYTLEPPRLGAMFWS